MLIKTTKNRSFETVPLQPSLCPTAASILFYYHLFAFDFCLYTNTTYSPYYAQRITWSMSSFIGREAEQSTNEA